MIAGAGYRMMPDVRGEVSPQSANVTAVKHLNERQGDFAAAVLDPERQAPPGLVGPDGKPSTKRFNVYRNNVVASLTEALKNAFPAVARIVGDEFFAAMARIYVAEEPPTSPVMLDYGKGFPEFIGRFEPVEILPYLQDVAQIERTWVEAYHAPEARSLTPEEFAQISPDHLPGLRVRLHPSLRMVRSRFPSLTIWQMNVADGVPASVDLDAGGEDILILRPDAEVEARLLPPGGAEFIQALGEGHSVIEAMRDATAADCRFDLATSLSGLMSANAFVGYDETPHPLQTKRPA